MDITSLIPTEVDLNFIGPYIYLMFKGILSLIQDQSSTDDTFQPYVHY